MVGTGVPKFVSAKTISYVIAAIVIAVAILVAWSYISAVFGEYIEPVKKGEEARFMRYMECAIAMCTAPNRKDDADGCTSDRVMERVVEYDENGNPVKGCQKVCEEIRDIVGVQKHYCSKDYAINFTFQDNVTYTGNHSCKGVEAVAAGEPGFCGIGIKPGWHTDVTLTRNWKSNLVSKYCFHCRSLAGGVVDTPAGFLLKKTGDCGREDSPNFYLTLRPGAIWVPESYSDTNCEDDMGSESFLDPDGRGLASCEFGTGNEFDIWAENSPQRAWCAWGPLDLGCFCTGLDFYPCPQVILCPK